MSEKILDNTTLAAGQNAGASAKFDDLNAAMERMMRIGPTEAMREDERAAGFEIILPGEREWFPASDWSAGDVISIGGRNVRIVAIRARQTGKGAFSRLITSIARAGLTPIIVEPMFDMPHILMRWGWKRLTIGRGFNRQEVWKPSVRWLLERGAKATGTNAASSSAT